MCKTKQKVNIVCSHVSEPAHFWYISFVAKVITQGYLSGTVIVTHLAVAHIITLEKSTSVNWFADVMTFHDTSPC